MKALTVRQPWASLIAAGAKTIETRPRQTGYRGRVAIHAAKAVTPDVEAGMAACMAAGTSGFEAIVVTAARAAPPLGPPLGAVVGSAVLTDCVPMVHTTQPRNGHCLVVSPNSLMLHGDPTEIGECVTDQRPFGDFRPGRWALLLDDAKPTTERCAACWGLRWRNHARVPGGDGRAPCFTCDGVGRCDPVPARGRPDLWEWTP